MNYQTPSLENVRDRLHKARSTPKFKKNFPPELWKDIFALVKEHSAEKVCCALNLNPSLLSTKMKAHLPEKPQFREVFLEPPSSARVVIEVSRFDLKARIEGPISCIESLKTLFTGD